jgi:hypothetical protein
LAQVRSPLLNAQRFVQQPSQNDDGPHTEAPQSRQRRSERAHPLLAASRQYRALSPTSTQLEPDAHWLLSVRSHARGERARAQVHADGVDGDDCPRLEQVVHQVEMVEDREHGWLYELAPELAVEALVTLEQAHLELVAGESAVSPRGIPHHFANVHAGTARMLITATPARMGPEYFREAGRW